MNRHLRLLGWLYVGYGALVLLVLAALTLYMLVQVAGSSGLPGPFELILIVALGGPAAAAVVGGLALHRGRPWARPLLLVLGVLVLFSFPFGTLLGVYTFWVLYLDEDSARAAGAAA